MLRPTKVPSKDALYWGLRVVVETIFALKTRKNCIILGSLFSGNMSVCSTALMQLDMV